MLASRNGRISLGLWAAAFIVRMVPTFVGGRTALLEYDDGVHLSAALSFISGHAPYRSFTFVQPPGALYAFTPAAVIGKLFSEPWGMVVARVTVAAAAATTAWLVYRTVRPRGEWAAVAAAVLYAVWEPAVLAGRTALLEPMLTLAVTASVVLISERPSRQLLSGALFAVACLMKLAAAPLLIVFIFVLGKNHGRTATLRWLAAGAITGLVLLAPFLIISPRALWQRVVLDQIGRPRDAGNFLDRIQFLSGWAANPDVVNATTVHGAALVAVIVIAVAIVAGARDPGGRIWAALALLGLALILAAPSFGYHYVEPVTAPLAICLGVGLARIRARSLALKVGTAAVLGLMLLASVEAMTPTRVVPLSVTRALSQARCPWTMDASLTIAADVQDHVCGGRIDYYGDILHFVRTDGADGAPLDQARALPGFQRELRRALSRADVVVLQAGDTSTWDNGTRTAFASRFTRVRVSGAYEVYEVS